MRTRFRSRVAASLPVVLAGVLGALVPHPAHARVVATNGETIVVVSVLPTGTPSISDIRATVLRPDGTLVGERTLAAGVSGADAAVASNGTSYLVAWGSEPVTGSHTVEATRMSGAGELLDGVPVELASTTTPLAVEGVGSNGDQFLVVWARAVGSGLLTGEALDAVRVSPRGVLLDPSPVTLMGGGEVQSPFTTSHHALRDIASNGSRYLMVYHGRSNYQYGGGTGFVTIGADLDLASIQSGSLRGSRLGGYTGQVASDGSRFLVVSSQLLTEGSSAIDAELVTTATLSSGWFFSLGRTALDGDKAAVGWDGRAYRVVWGERRPEDPANLWLLQRRTAPDGTALEGARGVKVLPSDHAFIDVACAERTGCLAVCRTPGGFEVLSLEPPAEGSKGGSSGCASAGAGTLATLALLAPVLGRRRRRARRDRAALEE